MFAVLLLVASAASGGEIPPGELSVGGVVIGESPQVVVQKLGEPLRRQEESDFLNLHYDYPHVRVSFSDNVTAGLYSDSAQGCTPRALCPGDSLRKMRKIYGRPEVAERETGRFYEYYSEGCWFQIASKRGRIVSISVACQP